MGEMDGLNERLLPKKKEDDELELRRPRDEDPRLAERRRPETTNATSPLAV